MNCITVDIETTGLDPKEHQILEVYMGYFDPFAASFCINEGSVLHLVIEHEMICGSIYALYMNRDLLWRIAKKQHTTSVEAARQTIGEYLQGISCVWAGKNFARFDRPFLENFLGYSIPGSYRTLDPAILYMDQGDTFPPSLDECRKRAGLPAHGLYTAVGDATLTAKLIWKYFHKT